jgi:nucleoside-diphosphate-sugar epimerase
MTGIEGKTMTIFGCGYVGSALARLALKDGMRVAALTRNPDTASCLRELGVNPVIEAELDSTIWHDKLNPRQDFVINCVSSGGGGVAAYHKSYFMGQSSILNWAHEGRVGTLVFTSSTSVYPQSGGNWIDEAFTHEGASERGKILLDAERLLTTDAMGIERYFILRLAGIYGPGRHHLLDQLRKGIIRVEDYVERHLNIIHRDDICSAITVCLYAPKEMRDQIFNVADNNPARKKNLLHWLEKKIGESPHTSQPLKAKQNQREETKRSRVLPDRKISNKKIKSMLGWSPVYPSYKEGYQAILQ